MGSFFEVIRIRGRCLKESTPKSRTSSLSPEEENIVRYVSGYVSMKLLKKYERSFTKNAVEYVECLGSMAVDGEESSVLEYSRRWILKVNRGGLFEVNDMAYSLFREIEIHIHDRLSLLLNPNASYTKESLVALVTSDVYSFIGP